MSHGSKSLLKTILYLLQRFDFKITVYVNLGEQGAGRREEEGSRTSNVVSVIMSVKFFNFCDKDDSSGINREGEELRIIAIWKQYT